MTTRVRGLQRLAKLYGVIEGLRSAELQAATAGVNEAARFAQAQQELERQETASGREAIATGDRQGLVMAESETELARMRHARAEEIRRAREIVREAASDAYRASRMRMEQMQSVARCAEERAVAAEQRRTQAALDDRHLARTVWRKTQER